LLALFAGEDGLVVVARDILVGLGFHEAEINLRVEARGGDDCGNQLVYIGKQSL
jgi:hypothetical protein